MIPSATNNQTLVFSRAHLQAIDREASKEYKVKSIVLMENAARGAATIILDSTDASLRTNIVVACGSGNNGGDGYAVARHLANHDCGVSIVQTSKPNSNDTIVNAEICTLMGMNVVPWSGELPQQPSLLIDAIFGTGLDRNIEGGYADIITKMNDSNLPCIALDIPSGLNCDTGEPLGNCIEASMTISFVGMKMGFLSDSSNKYTGEIVVSDIGCPTALIKKYGTKLT